MSGTDKILDAAYAAFETEAESLRATAGVLDRAEFEKAVSVLASAFATSSGVDIPAP